jgi:hypothetical protein
VRAKAEVLRKANFKGKCRLAEAAYLKLWQGANDLLLLRNRNPLFAPEVREV